MSDDKVKITLQSVWSPNRTRQLEITLMDLVDAVQDASDDELETFATLLHMLNAGRVRFPADRVVIERLTGQPVVHFECCAEISHRFAQVPAQHTRQVCHWISQRREFEIDHRRHGAVFEQKLDGADATVSEPGHGVGNDAADPRPCVGIERG